MTPPIIPAWAGMDIFSILILTMIYISARKSIDYQSAHQRVFFDMLLTNVVVLGADGLCRFHLPLATSFFLLIQYMAYILLVYLWFRYISAQIFPGAPPRPYWHGLVGIVLAADLVLILSSFQFGTVFYFVNDIYYRGPYFIASMTLSSSTVLISAAMLIRYRTRVEKKYFKGLLLYPLPPILAFFCQLVVQDFPFIPCAVAFSIIMIYLNIQNRIMDIDFLTGAYTRRRLNQHMERLIRQASAGHTFAAVMIDLDNFKHINDSYGHIAGDRVLQKTVALIKACIRHNDFIARYGGDEFCLVLDVSHQDDLDAVINRIRQAFYNQNRRRDDQEKYDLNFSMGYDLYDPSSHMNLHQIQHHIEEIMYKNKKDKHDCTSLIKTAMPDQ